MDHMELLVVAILVIEPSGLSAAGPIIKSGHSSGTGRTCYR